jgi:hypothetical protein
MAHLTLVAAYSGRRRSFSNRERSNDVGLAASLISEMWRSLSMRGTIRLWWRLVRIEAAPNPASARFFNLFRSDSSRSWREDGDKPWCQESGLSISTLPV